MKKDAVHTTNYLNTFIEIADDCPVKSGEVPPKKEGTQTAANLQFDMIYDSPYKYTSDDVIFSVYAHKNKVSSSDKKAEWEKFFSKGQPCMRSSPLTKRYGWGVHSDENGRIALIAADSKEYQQLAKDKTTAHTKAMRSKKA